MKTFRQRRTIFSSLSVLSEEGKSSIALASFSKWVYDQRFGNFRRNYKLFWPLKKKNTFNQSLTIKGSVRVCVCHVLSFDHF